MMQPRRISRELALLSISQLSSKQAKAASQDLQALVITATRALTAEIRDTLEVASSELERGNSRLLSSETRSTDITAATAMVQEAIALSQTAINRLGTIVDIPEFLQVSNQADVHQYAINIIEELLNQRDKLDQMLNQVMVDWDMSRLARIDQDILRIAATEMMYLNLPHQVAINEAVELAKCYSEQDGYRFINGVLRRLSDRLKKQP